MLFNSYIFIFCFLPLTLCLYFYISQYSRTFGLAVLLAASLIFYGSNDYHIVSILFVSIIVNFLIGNIITLNKLTRVKGCILAIGLIFNLGLLAYFKYTNFIIENINQVFNANFNYLNITLPIGISFFTFTQLAFLVDCYRGHIQKYNLLNYALFVTYFPHLIAGPIIHHKTVMPQFIKDKTFQFSFRNLTLGMLIFSIGLFKKTVIADYLSAAVIPVFDLDLDYITALDAWLAAVSYSFELYFDFSGYSDMAIGLSLLIGVRLPINFYSPYKALNIIDFWRRWNISLSHFLRDYLYFSFGGSRKGKLTHYTSLMATMLLGGLWHGANWTFVFWGFLHGSYLCIAHSWISIKKHFDIQLKNHVFFNLLSGLMTFLLVVIAWVFFRSNNFAKAKQILTAMFFKQIQFSSVIFEIKHLTIYIINLFVAAIIIWCLPNTYEMFKRYRPALISNSKFNFSSLRIFDWKPSLRWNLIMAMVFVLGVIHIQTSSVFLYFRF